MKRLIILCACVSLLISGCSWNFYKTTPRDKATITSLESEIDRLASLREQEAELRRQEREDFDRIQRELERKLKDQGVGLEMKDRGLIITLGDNILFDSGKAKIKDEAKPTVDKIIGVLSTTAQAKNIGIEGHTDNVPIKYSGWKSNRELSTARANNVYHYLVEQGLDPARLTTMGYGEFRSIATNDTEEGRARNRRVEIVILPEFAKAYEAELDETVK